MKNLSDILVNRKVIAEYESKYNGHMQVVSDLAWGVHIQADGLTQTAGVVKNMWKSFFKQAKNFCEVKSCLILGLGGGTVAKLIRKRYPEVEVTGVDIEPVFVEWGEKYFGMKDLKIETIVKDAYEFVQSNKQHFDLIIIDIYQGREYPLKFEEEKFLKNILRLLSEDGAAVFNRLYFGDKRPDAMRFLEKLEKVFSQVEPIYPEANVMFVCKK